MIDLGLQLAASGLAIGSLYSLLAVGFSLTLGVGRFFHFAHGAVYAWGAYLGYLLYVGTGLPFGAALLLAVVGAALLGLGVQRLVYEPLEGLGALPMVMMLSSLGIFIVLTNFLPLLFGFDLLSYRAPIPSASLALGPAVLPLLHLAGIAAALALIVGLQLFLRRSSWGKAIRAVMSNPDMAGTVGIDVRRVRALTHAIASALAAVAGILVGLERGIHPNMGLDATLVGAIAAVIGGLGSLPGAAVGGLLVGLAQNLGIIALPSSWQNAIAFGLNIVFVLFRPRGLLGKKLWGSEL